MDYTWVLTRYRSTDESGKKAVELAHSGIGYHIINPDRAKNEDVILAFKFANIKPIPAHLTRATDYQIQKLEDRDIKRSGVPQYDIAQISNTENSSDKISFQSVFA